MSSLAIQTKFHRIEGREWGNPQGKVILAFHGWLDNANSFEPLAPFFKDYRFISLDFPGHGKSSHKAENSFYYFNEYVLEVIAITKALGLDELILLAHSMGAAISTLVAGTNLLNIQKLILIEALGPLTNSSQSAPDILTEAIKQALHPKGKRETFFPDMESAVGVRMRAGGMNRSSAELLMERGIEKTPKGLKPRRDLKLHLNSFYRYTEDQIVTFCERIEVPTLLILGDKSEYPIESNFERRKKAIKNFQQTILPGGHHLHMDNPEVVAKTILEFLKKH